MWWLFFFFFFNSTADSQMCPSAVSFFKEFLIYHPLDVITLAVSVIKSSCQEKKLAALLHTSAGGGALTCQSILYQLRISHLCFLLLLFNH